MIQSFIDFTKNSQPFADFLLRYDEKQLINEFVPSTKQEFLTVIGQNSTHSLMAHWKIHLDQAVEELPVVWLDSEGSPISVFADSFATFLRLLPYDFGMIYDIMSVWEHVEATPNRYEEFAARFTTEKIAEVLARAGAKYPDHDKYTTWLKTQFHMEVSQDPFRGILDSIKKYPNFEGWLLR